jgi:hypothetical protein
MAEDEETEFPAQLIAPIISNAELDRLIVDLGTNPLAKGELRQVRQGVYLSLSQSQPQNLVALLNTFSRLCQPIADQIFCVMAECPRASDEPLRSSARCRTLPRWNVGGLCWEGKHGTQVHRLP